MPLEKQTPDLIPPVPEVVREGPILPDETSTLPTVVVDETPPPPFGRSWAFDSGAGQFVRIGSASPRPVYGAETLIQWIDKCLRTERGALPIHPPGYGVDDPQAIFGRPISQLSITELERKISDALTFHPRIAAVAGLELHRDEESESAFVTFQVQTDPPLDEVELRHLRFDLGNIL